MSVPPYPVGMVHRLLCVVMSTWLLVGIGACSTGADVPVLEATPAGLQAGTPIIDTLRTPKGTLLLGQVFPNEFGVTALMLVTGDPLAVWSDLFDQAARVGFAFTAGFGNEPCWPSTATDRWWDTPGEIPIPLTGRHPTGLTGLGCDAYGDAPAGAVGKRRNLMIEMRVGSAPEPYLAHLLVRYGVYATPPLARSPAQAPAAEGPSPVLPKPFTRVPAVGAPLGQPYFDGDGDGYRVAKGSVMVAPTFPGSCGSGGFLAVVRATESTAAVVDRYAEQFRQAGLTTEDRKAVTAGSTTASKVSLTTAGGGDGTITAVTAADGATYLLVERCND